MARVMIYEDSKEDLIERYEDLPRLHDVSVRSLDNRDWSVDEAPFRKAGFDLSKIRDYDPTEEIVGADIYFVDGLNGICFNILPRLPRERTFLNTGHHSIRESAKKQGYQILETTPEEAIQRVLKL